MLMSDFYLVSMVKLYLRRLSQFWMRLVRILRPLFVIEEVNFIIVILRLIAMLIVFCLKQLIQVLTQLILNDLIERYRA